MVCFLFALVFLFFSKFLRSRLKAFNNYINIYWDTRDIVKKNVKNKNNSNKQVVHPKNMINRLKKGETSR